MLFSYGCGQQQIGDNNKDSGESLAISIACGCGGTTRFASPVRAWPWLHSEPLDAVIGQVLVPYRHGGHHGRQIR